MECPECFTDMDYQYEDNIWECPLCYCLVPEWTNGDVMDGKKEI